MLQYGFYEPPFLSSTQLYSPNALERPVRQHLTGSHMGTLFLAQHLHQSGWVFAESFGFLDLHIGNFFSLTMVGKREENTFVLEHGKCLSTDRIKSLL